MKVKLRHARTQNEISKQNKNESSQQLLIAYTLSSSFFHISSS